MVEGEAVEGEQYDQGVALIMPNTAGRPKGIRTEKSPLDMVLSRSTVPVKWTVEGTILGWRGKRL